jgi:hypothetical protein
MSGDALVFLTGRHGAGIVAVEWSKERGERDNGVARRSSVDEKKNGDSMAACSLLLLRILASSLFLPVHQPCDSEWENWIVIRGRLPTGVCGVCKVGRKK